MRPDQLKAQRVQRVEMTGVHCEPTEARLVVWGIHGGGEYVIGLQVSNVYLERKAGEECDALRIRAMREVALNLPAGALRDRKGSAVGYFVYAGLPVEHCKATAERECRP